MRRALAAASDDAEARAVVADFIDQLGFDPLLASMADSRLLEPGGPVFGIEMSAEEMVAALDAAGGAGTAHRAELRRGAAR